MLAAKPDRASDLVRCLGVACLVAGDELEPWCCASSDAFSSKSPNSVGGSDACRGVEADVGRVGLDLVRELEPRISRRILAKREGFVGEGSSGASDLSAQQQLKVRNHKVSNHPGGRVHSRATHGNTVRTEGCAASLCARLRGDVESNRLLPLNSEGCCCNSPFCTICDPAERPIVLLLLLALKS